MSVENESAVKTHHPAVEHVLQFFGYAHLHERLQEVSRGFHALAHEVANRQANTPETTVALRKLLEAKDAAVRAALLLPTATVANQEQNRG